MPLSRQSNFNVARSPRVATSFAMFIKRFALICFALACFSLTTQGSTRPNFVFFLADDISWNDLGCYGHPTLKTPQIDDLAEGGLRFNNAYLTISSCSPSRCSIITGRYPHNTGAPELHTSLPAGQPLFPKLLKDTGYYTILSGKHHMGKNADPAFSKISKGKGPGKEADWVELLESRPKDKPFFAWYASSDAHRDWSINKDAPHYDPADVIIPPYFYDGEKTREDLTGYYHEVSRFDHFIGKVTNELRRQGILDDTVIIVMADNGRPLPRCKTRLYDSGIKTPFIVHYPALVKPGVTDSIISSIDVSATVLELAKVDKGKRIQGISFTPVLRDPKAVTRNVAFAEHNWHVYKNHERMVRFGPWLYIKNNFTNQQNLCVEAYKGGAGEDLWAMHASGNLDEHQSKLFLNPCPAEELYDVRKDPEQLNNLADDPARKSDLKKLRSLLAKWTKQTGDTIPEKPSVDRDAPPNQPQLNKKKWRHGEMPGAAAGAQKIHHPGPVVVD
jgi:N-sulfoglucosamine sulfohydrolase